jgi:hypothetical protein
VPGEESLKITGTSHKHSSTMSTSAPASVPFSNPTFPTTTARAPTPPQTTTARQMQPPGRSQGQSRFQSTSTRTSIASRQPSAPSQTQTESSISPTPQPVLRLRGATREAESSGAGRRIQWADGVIDNEGLGRKSSKGLSFLLTTHIFCPCGRGAVRTKAHD